MTRAAGEWPIQELAKAAGTTSRTLRHYGEVGLLPPSRVGDNGYRYYDQGSLVRLQRILLLRELGLGLPAIAEVLAGQRDTAAALRTHLELLEHERARLGRQIASVQTTLDKTEQGDDMMPQDLFDGFDHTAFRDEVVEQWGADAYERGDRWWSSMTHEQRQAFQQQQLDIAADYAAALRAGLLADHEQVQAITARHFDWIVVAWQGRTPTAEAFTGLGEMYAADPRFADNYERHEPGAAAFVREAMRIYGEGALT